MKIIKNNIKTIVTGIIFTIVGVTLTTLALASTAIDLAPYENDYKEKVSNIKKIEATLKTAKNELCVSERSLANAKLQAYLDKDIDLSKDDLVRLMGKSKWACGEDYIAEVRKKVEVIEENDVLDMDCLALGVATAETGNFARGAGVTKNNGFGIMSWPNGVRTLKTYATKQDSIDDFKRIWSKNYKVYPTYKEARRWTGNNAPVTWMRNVDATYNKCVNSKNK